MNVSEWAEAHYLDQKYLAERNDAGEIVRTKCNIFVNDCLNYFRRHELDGLDANAMIAKICGDVGNWKAVDYFSAQQKANADYIVIAGWMNTLELPHGHGHTALVVKGTVSFSKSFGTDVPTVASAGKDNFYGKPASFAFGPDKRPLYFLLDALVFPEEHA